MSDDAVRRWFEEWLERQYPGTRWDVRERPQTGVAPIAAPRKVDGSGADGKDDDLRGRAA